MGQAAKFHRSVKHSRCSFASNWPQSSEIDMFGTPAAALRELRAGSLDAAVRKSVLMPCCCCYRFVAAGRAVHRHRIAKRSDYLHVCAGNSRSSQAAAAARLGLRASELALVSYCSMGLSFLMLGVAVLGA